MNKETKRIWERDRKKTKEEDWIILDQLTPVILANVEGCVVDIGIGVTTKALRRHTKKWKLVHYSCDISPRKCQWAESQGIISFYGKSLDFIKWFPHNIPVALAFIDGEHIYKTVIQEVNFFLSKLSPGGIIFLHDTQPRKEVWMVDDGSGKWCGDVYKVREELEQRQDVCIFTFPYTAIDCGLTMVMKKDRWDK